MRTLSPGVSKRTAVSLRKFGPSGPDASAFRAPRRPPARPTRRLALRVPRARALASSLRPPRARAARLPGSPPQNVAGALLPRGLDSASGRRSPRSHPRSRPRPGLPPAPATPPPQPDPPLRERPTPSAPAPPPPSHGPGAGTRVRGRWSLAGPEASRFRANRGLGGTTAADEGDERQSGSQGRDTRGGRPGTYPFMIRRAAGVAQRNRGEGGPRGALRIPDPSSRAAAAGLLAGAGSGCRPEGPQSHP